MGWNLTTGIKLTRKQLEQRRLLAADDLASGMKQADVARKFGVSEASVSEWAKVLREHGKVGLRMKIISGRKSKLTEMQKQKLIEILNLGPIKYGYQNDLWTGKIVVEVIQKEFSVSYHFKHIPKLLRALGFRQVKPKRKPVEKDEIKKHEWLHITWEQIKKK